MKYMLLTYLDEKAWLALPAAEQRRQIETCSPHVQQLLAKKKLLDGSPLHPTSTATTVRYDGAKRVLTDGPFAETREQLGGYTIIEANDLDEAVAIATGFLTPEASQKVCIEVRPILDLEAAWAP